MILGNIGFGFIAKSAVQKAPLLIFLISTQLLDFIFSLLAIMDILSINTLIIITHGLLISILLSLGVMVVTFFYYRDLKISLIIGLLVFSHWLFDFFFWSTNIPLLFSNSPSIKGLGLANNIQNALGLEFGILIIGILIYVFMLKKQEIIVEEGLALEGQFKKNKNYMIGYSVIMIGVLIGVIIHLLISPLSIYLFIILFYLFFDSGFCGWDYSIWHMRFEKSLKTEVQ